MKTFEEHTWAVTLEEGSTRLACLDPCESEDGIERDRNGDIKAYCVCIFGSELGETLSGDFVLSKGEMWSETYGGYMEPAEYDWGVKAERLRPITKKEREQLNETRKREANGWFDENDEPILPAPPCLAKHPWSRHSDVSIRCVLPAGHDDLGRSQWDNHAWVKISPGMVFTALESSIVWRLPEWEKQASRVFCWEEAKGARRGVGGRPHCLLSPGHKGDHEFFYLNFAARHVHQAREDRALGILRELVGTGSWAELEPILGSHHKSLMREAAKLLGYSDPFEKLERDLFPFEPEQEPLQQEKETV